MAGTAHSLNVSLFANRHSAALPWGKSLTIGADILAVKVIILGVRVNMAANAVIHFASFRELHRSPAPLVEGICEIMYKMLQLFFSHRRV